METESVTVNSNCSSETDVRRMGPAAGKSLLVQWALYFSRFDPLVDLASDFEKER